MPAHAQAIARSHRIGQTKEVRVVHFEAVADADVPASAGGAPAENGEVLSATLLKSYTLNPKTLACVVAAGTL